MRTRFTILVVFAMVLSVVPMASVVADDRPVNPMVGSWESFDDFPRPDEGWDNSHVRMQIGNTGQFHLRDEGASICIAADFGFVPASINGSGDFEGSVFIGSGDLYCYPEQSGRQLWGEIQIEVHHDEDTDTLFYGTCWWRTGSGDPSDCPTP